VNTGITIVQGLLLIPLYLHYIGVEMYGMWLASGGMLGMLGMINFGVSSMVIQRVASAYGEKNHAMAGTYFINGVAVYLGICLLYAMGGWGASFWLDEILKVSGADAELLRQCFQLAVVAAVFGIFNECLRSFGQALLRPVIPMMSMAVGRMLGIGVTVWMLFYDFGLWAIPSGILVAESVIFGMNLLYVLVLFRKLSARIGLDKKIIKEYIKTSPALLMARMGNTLSQESEPLLITMFIGPGVTTAYMVTRRAADMVFNILSVIVGSSMSSFAHLAGTGDDERINGITKNLLVLSFSIGAIGFAIYVGANHAFVSLWVGESFALDRNIILFIAIGFFARTFRGLLGQMLYAVGDFVGVSIVIFMEGVVRVAVSVSLLSTLGVIGVPLAFSLSCLITVVVLGTRLGRRLSMEIYFPGIGRFLFSAGVLFTSGMVLTRMEFGVDSWAYFSLYLVLLTVGALLMFTLINWARCHDTYKKMFA